MDQFYQQQAMEQVSKGILQVAEIEEKKLDAQLKNLENLGEVLNSNINNHLCIMLDNN